MGRFRTNIEIEDDYLKAVMSRYGVDTKTEAVDLALRHRGSHRGATAGGAGISARMRRAGC